MPEICGIIADLRREEQGVYEFRRLSLMGFDNTDPEIKKLQGLGYKVSDANPRFEGVEITNTSPFQLMRSLAKEFSYAPGKPANTDAPGGRQSIMWTLIGGEGTEAIGVVADIKRESEGEYVIPCCTLFGLEDEEMEQLKGKGLEIGDSNRRHEGVEVTGASPFKVMRILCRDFGWTTDGEVMQSEAPGDRTCTMWTLTRSV